MPLAFWLSLVACGTPAASLPSPSARSGLSVETPSPPPSVPVPSNAPSSSPAASDTAKPATGEDGVVFATPVLIKVADRNLPAVLVTNNSDQSRSFGIGAIWKSGDSVTGSAMGAVMGLAAHETRAVNLASQNQIPDGTTSAEAHIDKEFPTQSNFAGVARIILFGNPVVHPSSFTTVDVPATNLDLQPHGFQVGAALLTHRMLIATASGQVPAIGPRVTLPVSMPLAGPNSGYDQILVYVNGVTN